MPDARRAWRAAAAVAAALVAAGCAAVPSSGPVHVGRTVPGVLGIGTTLIRAFPSGPSPGAAPRRLVAQYLDAQVDSDNDYGVARLFLTSDSHWNPAAGTTVYADRSVVIRRTAKTAVTVAMHRIGVIDGGGFYRPAPGAVSIRFDLVRTGGKWRIHRLPPGVLLSAADAHRSLGRVQLYYFNAGQTRLVPVPMLVHPDQPGLATTLVAALIAGPLPALRPTVTTAVPDGLELIGNVPINSHGVAEVNLSAKAQQLSPPQLQRLTAQIAWTLRQVPVVTGVRLLADGSPLTSAGASAADTYRQFAPDPPAVAPGLLYTQAGRVRSIGAPVPAALGAAGLVDPVVGFEGRRAAALRHRHGEWQLVSGPAASRLRPIMAGPGLSAPSVAADGTVLVSEPGEPAAVFAVPPTGAARRVRLPAWLRRRGVDQIVGSSSGARIAVVVGPPGRRALMVGVIDLTAGRRPVLSGLRLVLPARRDAVGIAWMRAGTLVTTGLDGAGNRQVFQVGVDGYRPRRLSDAGLPTPPTQVAAAPDKPIVVSAGDGIWSLGEGRWKQLSTGDSPSYLG